MYGSKFHNDVVGRRSSTACRTISIRCVSTKFRSSTARISNRKCEVLNVVLLRSSLEY